MQARIPTIWSTVFFLLLMPVTNATTEESTANAQLKPVAVVIGASYAASWPINEIDGLRVVNKGIGGNQSFEMRARFDDHVVRHSPELVIIWGFINDIFRSDPVKMESAKDRIIEGYREMVDKAESAGIRVVLATEVTIADQPGFKNWVSGVVGRMMGKTSYQDRINGNVRDVNEWIRSFALSRGLTVLDFERALADENGTRKQEFATEDGSHLTSAAYEALSEATTSVFSNTRN